MRTREGRQSPWGPVQDVTELYPGVESVSTAGHGGIKLDRRMNAKVPAQFRTPSGWYEEDCEWAIAAAAIPEIRDALKATNDDLAIVLAQYFPDAYNYFRRIGFLRSTPESRAIREREEQRAAKIAFAHAYGLPLRCSALGLDDGRVHVLFRYTDGREVGFYMSAETYQAEALLDATTPEDYRKHGTLEPAPSDFVFNRN